MAKRIITQSDYRAAGRGLARDCADDAARGLVSLTRALPVADAAKPTWIGAWRYAADKPWKTVRNANGHPIAYASEQAALDGAEFYRTRPMGRWYKGT